VALDVLSYLFPGLDYQFNPVRLMVVSSHLQTLDITRKIAVLTQ
jgi:hypothetical protein